MADSPPLLPRFFIDSDPALAAILEEYAIASAAIALSLRLEEAAVILWAGSSVAACLACQHRLKNLSGQPLSILILAANVAEPAEEDSGFDAVFKKPLNLPALLDTSLSAWRLRQLKQPRALTPQVVFNPFTGMLENPQTGQSQSLTTKEAAFLLALLQAGDQGISREKALTELWGYHRDVDSHAIETTLYRLRQKLHPLFPHRDPLISEKGIYRFIDG